MLLHGTATWGSSKASFDAAEKDCPEKDPSSSLINSTTVDLTCFQAYRAKLISEFPNEEDIKTSDIWLAKSGLVCMVYSGTNNTIMPMPCDSSQRERFLCTRPVNTSK